MMQYNITGQMKYMIHRASIADESTSLMKKVCMCVCVVCVCVCVRAHLRLCVRALF